MTIREKIEKAWIKNKKDLLVVAIIFVIAAIYSLPLFSSGFSVGHDNVIQLASAAARIEAVKDGQFPVRWAGDLNFGYGNPSFIFYYPLGGYLVGLLYLIGFSLETSYEILLAISLTLAPIFFYLWARQLFKRSAAFMGALFYGLAPYFFLDVYVRGHLGESLSLALVPLVLLFIERNLKKTSLTNIISGGFCYALFIHSHAIMSLMFSILFGFYILLKSSFRVKPLLLTSSSLILGLILSAYFWIPAIVEAKYINSNLFLSDWYKGHFISLGKIIYSPWGFGSNTNESGGLSAQIGPLHFAFALTSFFLIFRKIRNRKEQIFWSTSFLIAMVMSTDLSSVFWEKIHTLQRFQFPWRFTALSAFSASVLATYFFSSYNKNLLKVFTITSLLLLAIPMTKIPSTQNYGDRYYFDYAGTTTFHNEATTIWVEGDSFEFPKDRLAVISGRGNIEEIIRKSNLHYLKVNAETNIKVLDNTVYFPGWRVQIDGKNTPIEFQDPSHRGLITFDVPKGKHDVGVKFGESPIRLASDMISVVGLILVFFLVFSRKWLDQYLKT